uniref:Family with sequence similarity 92 member A1 n=1 Tax=Hucho hucho TaxID=62062 RepID=A0A4W5PG59_9TELE
MELTVSHSEKYLDPFCSLLASYTRKTAKLREQADMLDYRQAEVERLESKVVTPLKAYGDIVENKRADLKRCNADRNRALKELQKLEKLRQKNPSDRQKFIPLLFDFQAEVNAQKATNNAHRSTRQLEETISDFHRQILEDIKVDFITVEMVFHAKALEVYTHTFQNLDSMDIDKDLEVSHYCLVQTGIFSFLYKSSHSSILQRQRGVEEEVEEEYESEIEAQQSRLSYASQYTQILRQKN